MNDFRSLHLIAFAGLLVGLFLISFGLKYDNPPLLIGGLFLLGFCLLARGVINLKEISGIERAGTGTFLRLFSEIYFGAIWILMGLAIFAGTIAEISSQYISSGAFWRGVQQSFGAGSILFAFSVFLILTGLAMIFGNSQYGEFSWAALFESPVSFLEGGMFFVFGLVLLVLAIFVLSH